MNPDPHLSRAAGPATGASPRRRVQSPPPAGPGSQTLATGPEVGMAPWLTAVEKVKQHGRDVERQVDTALRRQRLLPPRWRPTAQIQVPSNPARSHPLSYLRLAGGTRLLMTQTLHRGTFGKFRLGLWHRAGQPPDPQVVALKELRLAHWNRYVPDPLRSRSTRVTGVDTARGELEHHLAPYSPLPSLGVVEFRGKLYVCMPLLGDDVLEVHDKLSQELSRDDTAFARLGLHLAYDGAEALAPMHAANVIHRDVKPENFLHGTNHRLRLSDFGMAIAVDPLTKTVRGAAGSPGYAAPEVLFRHESGPPADVWSLMISAVNMVLHDCFIPVSAADPTGIFATNNYRHFHASLRRRADGQISLADAIAEAHPPWSTLFDRLAAFNRRFARFMLNRGLNPTPARRADTAEVLREVGDLLASLGIDAVGGAEALECLSVCQDPYALARRQLEAFAEVMAAPRAQRRAGRYTEEQSR